MTTDYSFGFLRSPLTVSGQTVRIRQVNDLEQIVKRVLSAPSAGPTWFHPPLVKSLTEGVTLPAKRFELPITHVLTTPGRNEDPAFGEFLVLAIGFILGLRLTIQGTGHLQATPITPGELVSFHPTTSEVAACIDKAVAFWDARDPMVRRLMFGAIHYFLVAQGHDQQHQRFAWMYTVMDNLHRIAWITDGTYQAAIPEKGKHSERPKTLAKVFGSPLPCSFANPSGPPNNVDRLVQIRNELVHEARWEGEPLGYAVSQVGHDLFMELTFFCSQLILGLLKIECAFRKDAFSGQVHGLDVTP